MTRSFAITTILPVDSETVWNRALTMEGVNAELWPWIRMTHPAGMDSLASPDIELGKPLFRSGLLLLGFLPVEYDDITLAELGPGNRFLERSPMLTMKTWQHERTVEEVEGGCRVTDRLTFESRIPGATPLAAFLVLAVFRHRHRRLKGLY